MATLTRSTDVGQRLLQIRRELESRKETRSQLTGGLKNLQKRLSTDFKVESLEAAQKLLDKLAKEIEEAEKDLQKGLKEIEKMMEMEDDRP